MLEYREIFSYCTCVKTSLSCKTSSDAPYRVRLLKGRWFRNAYLQHVASRSYIIPDSPKRKRVLSTYKALAGVKTTIQLTISHDVKIVALVFSVSGTSCSSSSLPVSRLWIKIK